MSETSRLFPEKNLAKSQNDVMVRISYNMRNCSYLYFFILFFYDKGTISCPHGHHERHIDWLAMTYVRGRNRRFRHDVEDGQHRYILLELYYDTDEWNRIQYYCGLGRRHDGKFFMNNPERYT